MAKETGSDQELIAVLENIIKDIKDS